jgi:SAM-dependent methyltransferase
VEDEACEEGKQVQLPSRPSAMVVDYDLSAVAWRDYRAFLERLILEQEARRVCDLGGGANPVLTLDFVTEHGLDYLVADVSPAELAKAPAGYATLLADISSPDFDPVGDFDVVCSVMVAEHLRDPETFHRNVHRMLRPGGVAFHFFPTWYALPFVVNRFLPEPLTRAVLSLVQSGREQEGQHAKFKAYYRWCRGPTRRQFRRFDSLGFEVVHYTGFFGHGYYGGIKGVRRVDGLLSRVLVRHPIPLLTSFAFVVLRRT